MKLVNLTPHALTIFLAPGSEEKIVVPPSGKVARVATIVQPMRGLELDDGAVVPVALSALGSVEGLPPQWQGPGEAPEVYVVSRMVLDACGARADVYAPGNLRRGADGQPIGCDGLIRGR